MRGSVAHELAPGDVVSDRFVLQQEIGSGGSGVVWRANDIADLDRSVALKVIAPEYRADPRFLDRFRRELRTLVTYRVDVVAGALGKISVSKGIVIMIVIMVV